MRLQRLQLVQVLRRFVWAPCVGFLVLHPLRHYVTYLGSVFENTPKCWNMGLGRFMLDFLLLKALGLEDSQIPTFLASTVGSRAPTSNLRAMIMTHCKTSVQRWYGWSGRYRRYRSQVLGIRWLPVLQQVLQVGQMPAWWASAVAQSAVQSNLCFAQLRFRRSCALLILKAQDTLQCSCFLVTPLFSSSRSKTQNQKKLCLGNLQEQGCGLTR